LPSSGEPKLIYPDEGKEFAKLFLKRRSQTNIYFKIEIDLPAEFIPLLNKVTMKVESNRGDVEIVHFSKFTYNKETGKFEDWISFKIDIHYGNEYYAKLNIKDITVQLEKNLAENLSSDQKKYVTSFYNMLKIPVIPTMYVKIGGILTGPAKALDTLMPKLIALQTLPVILIGILAFLSPLIQNFIPEVLNTILDDPARLLVISYASMAGITFILLLFYLNTRIRLYREQKPR